MKVSFMLSALYVYSSKYSLWKRITLFILSHLYNVYEMPNSDNYLLRLKIYDNWNKEYRVNLTRDMA